MERLPQDPVKNVASFLDAGDLARIMETKREFDFLHRSDFWKKHFEVKWDATPQTQFPSNLRYNQIYGALVRCPRQLVAPQNIETGSHTQPGGHRVPFASFKQQTGTGNRSVRTVHPLPTISSGGRGSVREFLDFIFSSIGDILHSFCQGKQSSLAAEGLSSLRSPKAFILPRFEHGSCTKEAAHLDMNDQWIAYYEVEICATDEGVNSRNECIAVGLSCEEFPLEGYMPGWTNSSYAYHSDDGGIFHSSGELLRQFGPRYGIGDVVGCGVNYLAQNRQGAEIFFTLNGAYIGSAFQMVEGTLYPTVGIDANVVLQFNFGESSPFLFDVAKFQRQQHSFISVQEKMLPATPVNMGLSSSSIKAMLEQTQALVEFVSCIPRSTRELVQPWMDILINSVSKLSIVPAMPVQVSGATIETRHNQHTALGQAVTF